MAYRYIHVPWKRVEPVFNRFTPYTVYTALETNFRAFNCPADILKLVDGSTAYRVLDQYLYKYKKDYRGYFVDLASFGIFYFSTQDPSLTIKPILTREDWLPI